MLKKILINKTRLVLFVLVFIIAIIAPGYTSYNISPSNFNPNKQKLNIYSNVRKLNNKKVSIEIFNHNGSRVYYKKNINIPFYWNGKNNEDEIVKPGIYIVRITNNDNIKNKIVRRVLVQY